MLAVSLLLQIIMTHHLAIVIVDLPLLLQIIMTHHLAIVIVDLPLLLQIIMTAHQLVGQLIIVAHHPMVLLQIIMPLYHLVMMVLLRLTILVMCKAWMSTSSWTCTTKRVLKLEFHRLHGATPWLPAHRHGPNIWQRSMKWSTRQASPMARTLLDGPMDVVWHHSCPHSTIIMGYVLGIH